MALQRFGPLLGVKVKGEFQPYFRRVQQQYNKVRYRQLPFLAVSKEPQERPRIPDPRRMWLSKVDLAREMGILVGDRVKVLYGSEKGKFGIIGRILAGTNQVIVTGTNLKRSFWHPEPGPGRPSIVSVECPIHVTNVVLVDPVTKQPTRVKRRYMMNGECVRISKVSGCAMPEPVPVRLNEREELWAKHEEKAMATEKMSRGPPKEDIFGNRKHFQALVQIVRNQRATERAAQGQPALGPG
mmetsp:Transcript_44400/g.125693  ORF Transcript_44400/g.125693 Transcript_44400/m.125693 type:complete len:241 (+) Transcript_44400:73-795(+)